MNRLSDILAIAKREALNPEEVAVRNLQSIEYLHIDALAAVMAAITTFKVLAGCETKKWAMLFDELEIAPFEIQRTLFKNLRSGQHDLFFIETFPQPI